MIRGWKKKSKDHYEPPPFLSEDIEDYQWIPYYYNDFINRKQVNEEPHFLKSQLSIDIFQCDNLYGVIKINNIVTI